MQIRDQCVQPNCVPGLRNCLIQKIGAKWLRVVMSSGRYVLRVFVILFLVAMVPRYTLSAEEAPEKPRLDSLSFALTPVATVVPVFVAIECRENCEGRPFVIRSGVSAVTDGGQVVQTMSLNDAIAAAGGAANLSNALSSAPDSAVISETLGKAFTAGGQATLPRSGAGAVLGLLAGAIHSGYLYANPEAMQREKLASIAMSEYPRTARLGVHQGWVFFPPGNYRNVRLSIMGWSRPGLWQGSTASKIDELEFPLVTIPEAKR